MPTEIKVHFSDFFDVSSKVIDDYGAFNISIINDVPLFIDPFLLFNSEKPEYQALHNGIIKYLRFLRTHAFQEGIKPGLLKSWFQFSEVKQTWFGYSVVGNSGRGLGDQFAASLYTGLNTIFAKFGAEEITKGSHLEKLCLISEGIGRDLISDFTTNLIKQYLVEYTQAFAQEHIRPEHRRIIWVDKVQFNYQNRTWVRRQYDLPFYFDDYVLLTPKDILTHDDTWINRPDLINPRMFETIASAIPNDQLRAEIDSYFLSVLAPIDGKPDKEEIERAIITLITEHPELIDYYIRYKEDRGDEAAAISEEQVKAIYGLFVQQIAELVAQLFTQTPFYTIPFDTLTEAHLRVTYLKDVIENKGGFRLFYWDGKPVGRERDLQILYRLVWYATTSDVSREVDDGRGPVDFKISRGSTDKTLAEFKLAGNSKLKQNLANQVAIYQKASDADKAIKVIIYFTETELRRVQRILDELKLTSDPNIVLIDARADNKPSASKA